jgi:MoxR-like ATPase
MDNYEEKVGEIINNITETWYLSNPNFKVDGREYNKEVLLCVFNLLTRGNALLIGNYGWGKTTIAESLGAYFYGIPPKVTAHAKIRGHPFQTEEKMIGRPDLGELNKGREKVVWSDFVKLLKNYGIVDEINRMHEGHQNLLLDTVDRGYTNYLNEVYPLEKKPPFFATQNYPDEGNTPLIPPLLDRFDISIEVYTPINELLLITWRAEENKEKFRNPEIERAMLEKLEQNKDIHEEREKYRERLEKQEIPVIYDDELEKIENEISKIYISKEVRAFEAFTYTGANSIVRIKDEPSLDEHYEETPFGKIENNLSYRWHRSVEKFSKALTWFEGKEEVEIDDMKAIMQETLQHRMKYKSSFMQSHIKPEHYPGSWQSYVTKKWVKELEEYYDENKDAYRKALFLSLKEEYDKLKELEGYDLPQIRSMFDMLHMHKGDEV